MRGGSEARSERERATEEERERRMERTRKRRGGWVVRNIAHAISLSRIKLY